MGRRSTEREPIAATEKILGPVTIKDVARLAAVSVTTVSHVHSGKRHVAPETRRRVLEAARRLGYSPNSRALGLVTRRAMTIAICAPVEPEDFVLNRFFASMLSAVSKVALGEGYSFVFVSAQDRDGADQLVALANDARIDGVLALDPAAGGELAQALDRIEAPVVSAGRRLDAPEHHHVDVDHRAAIDVALTHLEERGYRAPALLTMGGDFAHVRDRLDSYHEWCEERALPSRVMIAESPTQRAGLEAVLRHAGLGFDAVVCAQGELARGVLRGLNELQRDVPDEVGVIGSTEGNAALDATPTLTTIESRPAEIGEVAMESLLALIGGRAVEPSVQIEPELIVRGSTARPGSG